MGNNVFQKVATEMAVGEERTINGEAVADEFPGRKRSADTSIDTPLDALNACEDAGLTRIRLTESADWVVRKLR
jgi:hypothetical protein